jgi:hypothetical protein
MEIVERVVPTTAAVASEDDETLKIQEPMFVTSNTARVDIEEK